METRLTDRPKSGDRLRRLASWVWALSPLASLGLLTPAVMVHAAIVTRSVWQSLSAGLYLVTWVGAFVGSTYETSWQRYLFDVGWALNMFVATVHALAIRRWVFFGGEKRKAAAEEKRRDAERRAAMVAQTRTLEAEQEAALAASEVISKVRARARDLARTEPTRARELRIGRPDVPGRIFPDGGLVDVNHAPAAAFVDRLGVNDDLAGKVVYLRDEVGGFTDYEELAYYLGDDKALAGHIDLLVFVPRA